jgi:catechol 2,3-dioxygenase-like lactoylglutathione lyase family enzyme
MPTSIAFYRDRLGFTLVQRSQEPAEHFDWALLRVGDVELMLNTTYEAHDRPPSPDPARVTSHADTALYFGCPDVDAAYEHLRAERGSVEPPKVMHYGMKEVVVTDPDGFQLHFHWPVSSPAT